MLNLFRRPSGIYVFRIAVPIQLRPVFGKREVVASTGSSELTIAKIVAGAQAAQWRQRFFDSSRLMSMASKFKMDHKEILNLAQGHPILLGGGHLTLNHASTASGISTTDLLRAAASGNLPLFVRAGSIRGHLVPTEALELDDPALGLSGGLVVPQVSHMPECAVEHIGAGLLMIPAMDLPGLTSALLTGTKNVTLVALDLLDHPGMVFVPNDVLIINQDRLEVVAGDVEMLRRSLSAMIAPEQIIEAKAVMMTSLEGPTGKAGRRSHELLSTALDEYITVRVRQDVGLESEITRIKNGCALLIDLGGDLPLSEITSDSLRRFRDHKLSQAPANENKIRLMYGTTSVASSMKKVEGMNWPIMSMVCRFQ